MAVEVALLGGSFNPPHVGHVLAAQYVHATQPVDEVWLMPSFHHPFGKPLESFEHRVAMCEAICRETSGWLKVSEVEREVGGEGRTVDTLEFLRARFPDHRFTLVVGSDIVGDLPRWKDPERIRALARMLVINRAGHPAPGAVGPPLAEVSSTRVRELLARGVLPTELVPRAVLAYAAKAHLYGL
ncbi:MAG: nicotinate (nicotinamide) nucleotide adenylyltransferase [Myxococcaceae bacterium]|nr:nicotinate (nicotinamide) nucleotide adenylyltransferase [Myxococcaceae bacterium]